MLAAPIYMPADPVVDFAGFPARADVARAMVFDHELLQVELKDDVPTWIWTPAIIAVLGLVALLLVATGVVAGRLGRLAGDGDVRARTRPGIAAELVAGVLERLDRWHPRPPAGRGA